MKRNVKMCIAAAIALTIGIAYKNHIEADAGRGAFFGGLTGATIGGATGGEEGAAIGGLLGATAGAAIGASRRSRYDRDYDDDNGRGAAIGAALTGAALTGAAIGASRDDNDDYYSRRSRRSRRRDNR